MAAANAKKAYSLALKNCESKTKESYPHVVILAGPVVPDYAAYPKIFYILISLFIALIILYGIGRMIITIIREHRI